MWRRIIIFWLLPAILISFSASCAKRTLISPDKRSERVYFDFNRASVRPQDRVILHSVASWLKENRKSITILEGHADQIGPARHNEILGENRARAVRVYLRDQGADPRQTTVISKGEREPLVRGKGRRALQPNRRVEIIFALTGKENKNGHK